MKIWVITLDYEGGMIHYSSNLVNALSKKNKEICSKSSDFSRIYKKYKYNSECRSEKIKNKYIPSVDFVFEIHSCTMKQKYLECHQVLSRTSDACRRNFL